MSNCEKEVFTPEQSATSNVRAAVMGALVDARNKGLIPQTTLDEIEAIDVKDSWIDKVIYVLYLHGKTLAVVPLEQNNAN